MIELCYCALGDFWFPNADRNNNILMIETSNRLNTTDCQVSRKNYQLQLAVCITRILIIFEVYGIDQDVLNSCIQLCRRFIHFWMCITALYNWIALMGKTRFWYTVEENYTVSPVGNLWS